MYISGSTLTLFDPEIERIACAIKRVVREANIAQGILAEDQRMISCDSEEEITMTVIRPKLWGISVKEMMKDKFQEGLYRQTLITLILKNLCFQV